MSPAGFSLPLQEGEQLLWQGRPAPRCYTFRHWLQALIGTILFLACSFWLMVGLQLVRHSGYSRWLIAVPLLLVIGAFLIGPGQLLIARWRWGKIFYALTDRRLLVRGSLFGQGVRSYPLDAYRQVKRKRYGKDLVSLRLLFRDHPAAVLECLEHPELLLRHLPETTSTAEPGDSV